MDTRPKALRWPKVIIPHTAQVNNKLLNHHARLLHPNSKRMLFFLTQIVNRRRRITTSTQSLHSVGDGTHQARWVLPACVLTDELYCLRDFGVGSYAIFEGRRTPFWVCEGGMRRVTLAFDTW
jgi:hypothetical protein